MRFAIQYIAGLSPDGALDGDLTPDVLEALLEEAGKFASEVLAPLNASGDHEGAKLENGQVRTAAGFKAAYKLFSGAGWNSMPFDPTHGGQGLPWLVTFAVQEMLAAANLSFQLCPLLTQAAVEALAHHGAPELQKLYLEKLVSGAWAGTMNLTEPQAGSDLAAVKTKAVRKGDHYRLTGQKIYITYGDHDLTENIVHLVLARLPDAPPGVKGISLFVAPKFLVNDDGTLGARNDVRCASLEHKLGIHASPTCVMIFGEEGEGAKAWLIAEENRGLEYMFTMMNNARLGVGLQGIGIATRAYQAALAYARERVQGKPMLAGGNTIFYQPDVRRMLLHMKAQIEAMRGLAYMAGAALDRGDHVRAGLLTPLVKAGATDMGCEISSLAVQVFGGMGFIEETGVAQFYRDARILPIYEGTNGIQANDLVFRKTVRDQGATARAFVSEMRGVAEQATASPEKDIAIIGNTMLKGLAALESVIEWMVREGARGPAKAAAGAYSYLRLFALVAGGFVMAKSALASLSADTGSENFRTAKRATALYYAEVLLPGAEALASAAMVTHEALSALPGEGFD